LQSPIQHCLPSDPLQFGPMVQMNCHDRRVYSSASRSPDSLKMAVNSLGKARKPMLDCVWHGSRVVDLLRLIGG
jgi:hypothetical protein